MKTKRIASALSIIASLIILPCFVSCEPDEIDAFAEGYRYGYEHPYKTSDSPISDDGNTLNNIDAETIN